MKPTFLHLHILYPKVIFFFLQRVLSYILMLCRGIFLTFFPISQPFSLLLFHLKMRGPELHPVLKKLQIYSGTMVFSALFSTAFLVNAKAFFFFHNAQLGFLPPCSSCCIEHHLLFCCSVGLLSTFFSFFSL